MEKTRVLLYKPKDRWQIWVCLLGTILLYVCAVALVRGESEAVPFAARSEGGVVVNVVSDPAPPPRAPEEPPEAGPPPLDIRSDAPEENPTPVPERKRVPVRNAPPLVRPSAAAAIGSASLSSAKVLALSAPRPEYPYEARRQRLTGSGVAVLLVDSASGAVTNVSIARSTGSPILDNAAISGFSRWRFKPGTISKVHAPITFTLTGAAY
jgi:protein TonB